MKWRGKKHLLHEAKNAKRKSQIYSAKRKIMNEIKSQLKVRVYHFSIKVIKFVVLLPKEQIYWIIIDQLVRSATSIGANVIEAQSASSKRDFIKFYEIALKSANECKYWLGILRDATDTDNDKVNIILAEAKEIANILRASLLTLKNKR